MAVSYMFMHTQSKNWLYFMSKHVKLDTRIIFLSSTFSKDFKFKDDTAIPEILHSYAYYV